MFECLIYFKNVCKYLFQHSGAEMRWNLSEKYHRISNFRVHYHRNQHENKVAVHNLKEEVSNKPISHNKDNKVREKDENKAFV